MTPTTNTEGAVTDVAAIAAKLTKAQRAIVAGECRDIGNPPTWILIWPEAKSPRGLPTLKALTRVGILSPGRFGSTSLTERGLAVRNHLTEQGVTAS